MAHQHLSVYHRATCIGMMTWRYRPSTAWTRTLFTVAGLRMECPSSAAAKAPSIRLPGRVTAK